MNREPCEACGEVYDSFEYWQNLGRGIRQAQIEEAAIALATLAINLRLAGALARIEELEQDPYPKCIHCKWPLTCKSCSWGCG